MAGTDTTGHLLPPNLPSVQQRPILRLYQYNQTLRCHQNGIAPAWGPVTRVSESRRVSWRTPDFFDVCPPLTLPALGPVKAVFDVGVHDYRAGGT